MAKLIKITDDYIEQLKSDFEKAIKLIKLSDGKLNFQKSFDSIDRVATIYFTESAWIKMTTLVSKFDKEIGWHGLAKRGDNPDLDEYIIYDILVYPQTVTGTTVNTDQEKYEQWLYQFDDERFNDIRMQGHSHVNMGVTPSSVDEALYEGILEQIDDGMFYIFMIWNKRGERTIKVYDLAKNVFFDTKDCVLELLDLDIDTFLASAKECVKETTTTSYVSTYYRKEETAKTEPAKADNNAIVSTETQSKKEAKTRKGFRTKSSPESDYWGSYYKDIEDKYYGYGGYYD